MHGITEKIIWRNTAIPCTYSQEFTTYQNNQTGMIIHIVQGEREMVVDNRSLARFEITGIPPAPASTQQVKITFNVDADGLLTVTAGEQKVEVKPSYGLAEGEIERMILESMEKGAADMELRLLTEARTEAQRLLIALKNVEIADAAIVQKSAELEQAIKGNNRQVIDKLREELNHLSEKLAEEIMNTQITKALGGKNIGQV
jgi:molecular chaperone HscA